MARLREKKNEESGERGLFNTRTTQGSPVSDWISDEFLVPVKPEELIAGRILCRVPLSRLQR